MKILFCHVRLTSCQSTWDISAWFSTFVALPFCIQFVVDDEAGMECQILRTRRIFFFEANKFTSIKLAENGFGSFELVETNFIHRSIRFDEIQTAD